MMVPFSCHSRKSCGSVLALHLCLIAIHLVSISCVLDCVAASSSAASVSVEISADDGGTWHALQFLGSGSATTKLPLTSTAGGVLSARTQNVRTSIPSFVVFNSENNCKSVTLIRWVTAVGAAPFALGWTRNPTLARRRCEEDSPIEVRTIEKVVKSVKPRWAGYVRSFSVEDAEKKEQAAADLRQSGGTGWFGWLIRWQKVLLPVAVFIIVALANGIYLGITAIEEEEAAELRAREERLLRRVTGQPEPRARVTVTAPRPPKKKRKGKQ